MGICVSSEDGKLIGSSVESDHESPESYSENRIKVISNVQTQISPQSQHGLFSFEDLNILTPKRRNTLSPSNVQEQLSPSQSSKPPKKRSFIFDVTGICKSSSVSCQSFVRTRKSILDQETDTEEKSQCNDFRTIFLNHDTSDDSDIITKSQTKSRSVSIHLPTRKSNPGLFAGADDPMSGWNTSDLYHANRFLRFKYERIRARTWDLRSDFGTHNLLNRKMDNEIWRRRTPILSRQSMSYFEPQGIAGKRKLSPSYKSHIPKPTHITKFLRKVLIECSLFKGIDSDEVAICAINEVIKEMYTKDLNKGSVLVRQGEIGDAFFLVEYGKLDVLVKREVETEKETIIKATISAEETVGEAALMYNMKRSATLMATESTRVWVMEASYFHNIRDLIKKLTKKKIKDWQKFLSTIPLFSKLRPYELMNLTQACREVRYQSGQIVISREENRDSDIYIITTGKALLVKDRSNSISICQNVMISKGDIFMINLDKNETLQCVKALSTLNCLKLAKDDYNLLMPPYRRGSDLSISYSGSEYSEGSNSEQELPWDYDNRVPYSLDDFQPLAIAGVGNFGHVVLVKAEKDAKKEVFALKLVEKNKAINQGQTEHMKNERRVLFMMNSPFIVKLFATYQDETCVYFLLEKVLGGELWSLLRQETSFSETKSRFYAACIVLALQHIHSFNIVYRDLKPENVLISENGYAKVTDFGFAKKRNQSTSLCGTPEYLAPELITGGIQSFGVDWWCLGIFVYEMLMGQVPFQDSESLKLYEDIMESTPSLPESVTWEAQELIHGFLKKNSFRRLGSGPRGAGEVKEQIWFDKVFSKDVETFCWKSLETCKLQAPYIPTLRDDEDDRYFKVLDHKQETTELSLVFDPSLYDWCEEF